MFIFFFAVFALNVFGDEILCVKRSEPIFFSILLLLVISTLIFSHFQFAICVIVLMGFPDTWITDTDWVRNDRSIRHNDKPDTQSNKQQMKKKLEQKKYKCRHRFFFSCFFVIHLKVNSPAVITTLLFWFFGVRSTTSVWHWIGIEFFLFGLLGQSVCIFLYIFMLPFYLSMKRSKIDTSKN